MLENIIKQTQTYITTTCMHTHILYTELVFRWCSITNGRVFVSYALYEVLSTFSSLHKSTLQSAQHPLTDHQTRGSSMQCIHYLQLIALAGVTVKNELKFICSLCSLKYLHRMRNCPKALNHLGCSRTPFIMYASATAWILIQFGSACN